MTVSTETVINPPSLGVRLSDVTTDGVPQFALRKMVETSLGNTYRFVRTTKALAQGSVYVIGSDGTVGDDVSQTGTSIVVPVYLGVPQIAVAAPSGVTYNYCWVQTAGTFTYLKLAAGTAKENPLYLCSAAGALSGIQSATSSTMVHAVRFLGSSAITGAGSTVGQCFASHELFVPREAP